MTKPVIVTRAGKGSALTWTEGDTNLTNLRDATITVSDGTSSTPIDLNGTITFAAGSGISVDESTGTITISNTQSAGIALSDLSVGTEGTASGDGSISYNNTTGVFTYTPPTASGIGALANLVEDTTPQLGGTLDANGNSIDMGTNTITDTKVGNWDTAYGWGNHASSGYLTSGGALGTPSSGNLSNTTVDGTNAVGFKNLPAVGTKTTSYTLTTSDKGKYVQVGSGGSITIPDATFAEGDVVVIANNHSSAITITCSITTAYIAGTDVDKASVSLATRGVATIIFLSATRCIITGNVS